MANVFLTGANRGIGLELARHYRAAGHTVYAACRTTSAELDATGAVVLEGCDVTSPTLRATVHATLGNVPIHIAILNAGVLSSESLGHIDWEQIRRQFEVNSLGPLRSAEAIADNLGEGAKIAIITSRMGSIADNTSGGMYGYRASKAAVNAIGRSLAHDLRPRGVAVQLLHPGFVRTDMTRGNGQIDPDQSAALLAARVEELTLETTGTFRHANGEWLPW